MKAIRDNCLLLICKKNNSERQKVRKTRFNNYKYLCSQLGGTQIYKGITNLKKLIYISTKTVEDINIHLHQWTDYQRRKSTRK